MTAVLDLRTTLSTALDAVLGTYTLANGTSTPAVDVRAIGQGRETGTTVAGVELVIQRDPIIRPIRAQEDEGVMLEWTAFLVEWTGGATASRAAQLAIATIPGCDAEVVEVPENVGPVHQYRLLIRQVSAATATDLVPAVAQFITTLSGLNITTLAGDPLITL